MSEHTCRFCHEDIQEVFKIKVEVEQGITSEIEVCETCKNAFDELIRTEGLFDVIGGYIE